MPPMHRCRRNFGERRDILETQQALFQGGERANLFANGKVMSSAITGLSPPLWPIQEKPAERAFFIGPQRAIAFTLKNNGVISICQGFEMSGQTLMEVIEILSVTSQHLRCSMMASLQVLFGSNSTRSRGRQCGRQAK